MKKQSVLRKGVLFNLLVLVFVGGTVLASYGASCGDVNGSGVVDIVDALMIAQYYVGLNPTGFNSSVADVNASGGIDIVDALRIAQYYVGTVTTLTCSGTVQPPSRTATPRPGTATPRPATPTPGGGTAGPHLDNPFSGASWYVNPDWSAKASGDGGSAIANCSTAVWIDRIAAIGGGSGSCTFTSLTQHMDRCVSQGKNLIILVIYDMPNRDCSSTGSNGELRISSNGVSRYKTEYIDPIVAILRNYPSLRIVCIVEPDSLPNLVTNLSKADCSEANSTGAYRECTTYAINQLDSVGNNVYQYIDIAHDAWLGWDSNFQPFIDLVGNIVSGTTGGKAVIDGFVSNVANTLPWEEPFIPDANASVGGVQIKQSRFYDWNPYTMERTFISNIRTGFVNNGFSSSIGMLLDTSRNGWGGPNRPTAKSTATDVNTFVDQSRIDRRYHRGNWCNQGTAGIGARPAASPASGMDAFVWIKPPGESDGQSTSGTDPCDPNKKLDQMCVPGGQNIYCSCGENGAMSGAPVAGGWFSSLFRSLVANAYPAL